MSGFAALGVMLAILQAGLAILVLLSMPSASKRGSGGVAALYAVVGFATVVWMIRAALWQV